MKNRDIREKIKSAGVRYWEVADALGIGYSTFSVKLRHELKGEEKSAILAAIDALVKEREAHDEG